MSPLHPFKCRNAALYQTRAEDFCSSIYGNKAFNTLVVRVSAGATILLGPISPVWHLPKGLPFHVAAVDLQHAYSSM